MKEFLQIVKRLTISLRINSSDLIKCTYYCVYCRHLHTYWNTCNLLKSIRNSNLMWTRY